MSCRPACQADQPASPPTYEQAISKQACRHCHGLTKRINACMPASYPTANCYFTATERAAPLRFHVRTSRRHTDNVAVGRTTCMPRPVVTLDATKAPKGSVEVFRFQKGSASMQLSSAPLMASKQSLRQHKHDQSINQRITKDANYCTRVCEVHCVACMSAPTCQSHMALGPAARLNRLLCTFP